MAAVLAPGSDARGQRREGRCKAGCREHAGPSWERRGVRPAGLQRGEQLHLRVGAVRVGLGTLVDQLSQLVPQCRCLVRREEGSRGLRAGEDGGCRWQGALSAARPRQAAKEAALSSRGASTRGRVARASLLAQLAPLDVLLERGGAVVLSRGRSCELVVDCHERSRERRGRSDRPCEIGGYRRRSVEITLAPETRSSCAVSSKSSYWSRAGRGCDP